MRNVFCGVKKSTNTLNILPNGNCTLLPLLKKTQYCILRPCYTQWITLSWQQVHWDRCTPAFLKLQHVIAAKQKAILPYKNTSAFFTSIFFKLQCSSTCGSGKRLREVKCYADNEEDKTRKSCDPKLKPPTEDICNLIDCPNGRFYRVSPDLWCTTQFTWILASFMLFRAEGNETKINSNTANFNRYNTKSNERNNNTSNYTGTPAYNKTKCCYDRIKKRRSLRHQKYTGNN